MKRLLLLILFCLPFRVWADVSVIVYNVGTNMVSYGFSTGSPNASSGTGNLLPGQIVTNTSGVIGTNFYINWGVVGSGNLQYFSFLGFVPTNSYPPNPVAKYGPVPIAAYGHPTNCTFTMTIINSDIVVHTYQLISCSLGNIGTVTVGPVSSQLVNLSDPSCQGCFSYYQIPGYIDLQPPGYNPYNNPGIGPGDNPVLAANGGSSYGAPGANGGGNNQTTGGNSAPPVYQGGQGTNSNTNGPINFGTNQVASPTNAANNYTIQQGDNALYAATTQGDNNIVDAIQTLDRHNQTTGVNQSNQLGQIVANTGNTSTNTGVLTNQMAQWLGSMTNTNANSFIDTNSMVAQAEASATAVSNAVASAIGPLPTSPDFAPGSANQIVVPLGTFGSQSFSLTIDLTPYFSIWAPYRMVIAWMVVLAGFWGMVHDMEWQISLVLSQRQMKGNSEEVAGTNASLASGLVYAGWVTIIVVSLPGAFMAYFQSSAHSLSSFVGAVTSVTSHPIFSWMNALLPFDVIAQTAFTYWYYRFGIGGLLTIWVRTKILWFVS